MHTAQTNLPQKKVLYLELGEVEVEEARSHLLRDDRDYVDPAGIVLQFLLVMVAAPVGMGEIKHEVPEVVVIVVIVPPHLLAVLSGKLEGREAAQHQIVLLMVVSRIEGILAVAAVQA